MKICYVCKSLYDETLPGARDMTCSDRCHSEFLEPLIDEFGQYKCVVDAATGIKHMVPTQEILEKGIRQEDLKNYPVWED